MSVSIELQMRDEQLVPFRAALLASRCDSDGRAAELIEQSAHVDLARVPDTLRNHIAKVGDIAALLSDKCWNTDTLTRRDLTAALAYFQDVDDLIPDNDPRFGLLDDAIVIELAIEEHAGEWSQWQAFRKFRESHEYLGAIGRAEWTRLVNAASEARKNASYLDRSFDVSQSRSRYRLMTPLPRIDM